MLIRPALYFLLLFSTALIVGCADENTPTPPEEEQAVHSTPDTKPAADVGQKAGNYQFLPANTVLVGYVRPRAAMESRLMAELGGKNLVQELPTPPRLPKNWQDLEELTAFFVAPKPLPRLPPFAPSPRPTRPSSDPHPEEAGGKEEHLEKTEQDPPGNPLGIRVKFAGDGSLDAARKYYPSLTLKGMKETQTSKTYQGRPYTLFVTSLEHERNVPNGRMGGATYQEVAVYELEDRDYLLGSEWLIKQVLQKPGQVSPVHKLLRDIPSSAEAGVVMTLEGREDVRDFLKAVYRSPGPKSPLLQLRDQVLSVQAFLNLGGASQTSLLTISCAGVREDVAPEMESTIRTMLTPLQASATAALNMQKQQFPELASFIDQVSEVINSFAVSRNGRHVTLELPYPQQTEELAKNLKPVLKLLRQKSSQQDDKSRLQRIGVAWNQFHDRQQAWLPTENANGEQWFDKNGKPQHSWRLAVLRFMYGPNFDQSAITEYRLNEPWDSEQNKSLIPRMPAVLQTPGIDAPGKTGWRIFSGPGVFQFEAGKQNRMRDMRDGLSNTILAVQVAPEKAVAWTDPSPLPFDPNNSAANKAALGHYPGKTFLVLMGDGQIHELPVDIDPDRFAALLTHAGKESVRVDESKVSSKEPTQTISAQLLPKNGYFLNGQRR